MSKNITHKILAWVESLHENSKYFYRGGLSDARRLRIRGFRSIDSRGERDDLRRPATGGLYHGLHPGVRDAAGRFGEDLPEWLRRLRGRERQILGRRRLPRVKIIEA